MLNAQELHFRLSLQVLQTFDESMIKGSSRIIFSTAWVIGLFKNHAKRRTDTDAVSENCGE